VRRKENKFNARLNEIAEDYSFPFETIEVPNAFARLFRKIALLGLFVGHERPPLLEDISNSCGHLSKAT